MNNKTQIFLRLFFLVSFCMYTRAIDNSVRLMSDALDIHIVRSYHPRQERHPPKMNTAHM